MKKGWFNNWKMRYVTCSEHILAIYKTKGDQQTGHQFNVIDCHVKRIDAKRWNRRFVFRVKIANKRIYLAAEDDNTLTKWFNAIRGKAQRASLLGANAIRCAQGDKRRSSTMACLSRADCQQMLSFKPEELINAVGEALYQSTNPEAQFKFAEICGQFLAISHSQTQGLFSSDDLHPIPGLTLKHVDLSQRKQYLKQMRSTAALYAQRNSDFYIPLQCLIDFGSKSVFIESKIENEAPLSESNIQKLRHIGFEQNNVTACEDSKGRIWIRNAKIDIKRASASDVQLFVKLIDTMQIFVFDSQSLSEAMKSHQIPVSQLPKMSELTAIPGIRILMQVEMIARVCKKLLSEILKDTVNTEWTTEIVRFFNLVLGNSVKSNDFWENKLSPAVQDKFGVEVNKSLPLLHFPQLFFSLQFHTGADFKDINTFDFTEEKPILLEHLNAINSVPHHCFIEICSTFRELGEDPYKLLCCGYYNQAMLALNNKVSLYQSIFGDENIFVASGLAQLSQAYLGLGDIEKADLCSRGAIGAGRHYHAALITAYLTLIATCKESEINNYLAEATDIVTFQLGDSHWFLSDILYAGATAYQNQNDLQAAVKLAQQAVEIVHPLLGPGHPKTARCSLLQGRIYRMMGQFALAQPLIQQAMYAMTSSFGEDSVQTAECQFDLADVLLDSGKPEDADEYALKAYSIRHAKFESDNALVIDSVQQLAIIYDTQGQSEKAFGYYRVLLGFLNSLEDESVFEETIKIMRNMLCLFFRSIGSHERQIVNQLKRRHVSQDAMKEVFTQIVEVDLIDYSKKLFENYKESGEPTYFETLACIYHFGLDELSALTWLEEH